MNQINDTTVTNTAQLTVIQDVKVPYVEVNDETLSGFIINYDFTPTEIILINTAANKYYNKNFNDLSVDESEYLFNAWIKGRI